MEKPVTSEEKLLKLIRKKDKDAKNKAQAKQDREDNSKKLDDDEKGKGFDFISLANKLLVIVILGLVGYVVVNHLLFKKENEPVLFAPVEPKGNQKQKQTTPKVKSTKSFSSYEQVIGQRDIFQSPWEKPKVQNAFISSTLSELKKKIKLVGIVVDEESIAIIEDVKSRETSFLTVGESISGAQIEEITEEKVVFILNDERVEFKP